MHRLARSIPLKTAMAMLLTGRRITVSEAHRLGLVSEVVPLTDLLPAARRWHTRFSTARHFGAATKEAVLAGSACRCRQPSRSFRRRWPGAGLGRPGGRRERVSREESSQMVGPLKNVAPLGGVTVLDFTQIELGRARTQVLGDFGADRHQDRAAGRRRSLPRAHEARERRERVFWSLNRNKRSVAIDVRAPARS